MVKHEWGQAQDELQTVIMLQPTLAHAYDNLGVVRYTMGNHAGAIKAYRQALELRPDYADSHYRLGLVLTLVNRNMEASSEYVAAATAGLPRAQYFAGAAYASGVGVTRNLATALQWWFQAAEQEVAEAKEALSEMRRVALLTDAHSPEERRAALQAFEDFVTNSGHNSPISISRPATVA
jgi:TPR repeat protein